MMLAPLTLTFFSSPAASVARFTADATPSVTNVNDEPGVVHYGGTRCVTTKCGRPSGGLPPHPFERSNVRRPTMTAPKAGHVSRKNLAVAGATFITSFSEPGTLYSVSPPMDQVCNSSTSSLGPATKPSSDMLMYEMTFPIVDRP